MNDWLRFISGGAAALPWRAEVAARRRLPPFWTRGDRSVAPPNLWEAS